MLVDKKREDMYFKCLMHKKKLDRKLSIAKAIILVPSLLLLIGTVIFLIMLMFSDILVMGAGAIFYGYQSKGAPIPFFFDLIVFSGYIFLGINLTIFKTEFFLKKFPIIYASAIFVFFLSNIIFGYNPIYLIIGIVSLLTALWNKKLIEEDNQMSTLDGYPHFNPTLMKHTDTPFVPPTKEELDEMSADERIMYEREH